MVSDRAVSNTPAPFTRPAPAVEDDEPVEDEWPEWADNPQWQRNIDNDEVLYTLGALSMALGRQPVSIRKWEEKGIFPRSPWRGPRGIRLYPYEAIAALVIIGERYGIVGSRKTPTEQLQEFGQAAQRLFANIGGAS